VRLPSPILLSSATRRLPLAVRAASFFPPFPVSYVTPPFYFTSSPAASPIVYRVAITRLA